jgi:uncharacterized Zn finger protein
MANVRITQTAPPPTRELRGLALYRERGDEITHEGHGVYTVPGCSGSTYTVDLAVFGGEECCDCPDRAPVCKHVYASVIHRAKARARAKGEQAARTTARASRASLTPLTVSL